MVKLLEADRTEQEQGSHSGQQQSTRVAQLLLEEHSETAEMNWKLVIVEVKDGR